MVKSDLHLQEADHFGLVDISCAIDEIQDLPAGMEGFEPWCVLSSRSIGSRPPSGLEWSSAASSVMARVPTGYRYSSCALREREYRLPPTC
jgi:hypothetical protein